MANTSKEKYTVCESTGCWNWNCFKDKDGYGRLWHGGKKGANHQAHRFFYEEKNGKVSSSLVVDHLCNNPSCVNPDHLRACTQKENVQRGRLAKLNPKQIIEVRKKYSSGLTQISIAREYGVGQDQISRIVNYKRWSNIK